MLGAPKPYGTTPSQLASLTAGIVWKDPSPCFKKAYLCSIFSQWAYAEIPEWEFKEARMKRVKLIKPSSFFEQLIIEHGRKFSSIQEFVGEQGRERQEGRIRIITTIITRLVVAVILEFNGVIFISLRGTVISFAIPRALSMVTDLLTDAYVAKKHPLRFHPECGFHRGFYVAVTRIFNRLREAILRDQQNYSSPPLIYVTGHSLGGGMAAILHALWNTNSILIYPRVSSAYTFGMPRFGNKEAMRFLTNARKFYPIPRSQVNTLHPYHLLHPKDNIPGMPSRKLHYADSEYEWLSTTGGRIRAKKERDKSFLNRLAEWCGVVPNHDICQYIEHVGKLADKGIIPL